MVLNGIGSRRFLVNLFSEFILNKLPKESKTILEIADCENFWVIKGKTTYNQILEISKIKDEFISKYSKYIDKEIVPTIDLIEYDKKINDVNSVHLEFYNSENPDYSSTQLDLFKKDNTKCYSEKNELKDTMIITNLFPTTTSVNNGKLLYYYGKHIMYNIPPSYPTEKINMIISYKDVEIYNNDERDLSLESAILDVFDFEMGWLENEINKVDFCSTIINPTEDFEFLKRKVKDFVII